MVRPPMPLLLTCGRQPVKPGRCRKFSCKVPEWPLWQPLCIAPAELEASMQSTRNLSVIGLDLAKSVFQLHIVDVESGEIQRRQIKRASSRNSSPNAM